MLTLNTMPGTKVGGSPSLDPYRVLPDNSNPCTLPAPPETLEIFVKPVPSVLTLNTVPLPPKPPLSVVPYRMVPDKTNEFGPDPSLELKLCKFVKPVPSVLSLNTVPEYVVPYKVLPDKSKP